tara:strand:- start:1499 stop:1819 length:321 start_codon:yes stop_codon:yes gene_type:complete
MFGRKKRQLQAQLNREESRQESMAQAITRVGQCLKQRSAAAAYHAATSGEFSRTVTQKMADAAERQKAGDDYGCTGLLAEAGELALNEHRQSILKARELRQELEVI